MTNTNIFLQYYPDFLKLIKKRFQKDGKEEQLGEIIKNIYLVTYSTLEKAPQEIDKRLRDIGKIAGRFISTERVPVTVERNIHRAMYLRGVSPEKLINHPWYVPYTHFEIYNEEEVKNTKIEVIVPELFIHHDVPSVFLNVILAGSIICDISQDNLIFDNSGYWRDRRVEQRIDEKLLFLRAGATLSSAARILSENNPDLTEKIQNLVGKELNMFPEGYQSLPPDQRINPMFPLEGDARWG